MANRSLGTLTLDLVARIFGFRQGMDQAARIAEERSRRINRAIGGISRSFGGLIGGFGFGLLIRGIVRATKEAEFAVAQLDAVVKSTGGAAGFTTPQLVEMSEALRDVTVFSDEAIQSMEGVLLSFTSITGREFERALELIADVSTALGRDLSSSAIIVGRALNNPTRGMNALSRAGIVFNEQQRKVIKNLVDTGKVAQAQNLILNELEARFGGSARAARETFGGALEGLKNTASDLLEVKGGLPDITDSINTMTIALQDPALREGLDTLASGLTKAFLAWPLEAAGTFAASFKNLVEEIAAFAHGAPIGDLVRLQDEQARVTRAYNEAVNEGNQERADFFDRELKDINERLRLTEEEIKVTGRYTEAQKSAATQRKRDEEEAEESADKIIKNLEKQIALFGQTGKAAEARYDVEHGAYDLLSDKEQDRIVALSTTLDLLGKYKDLVGELSVAEIGLLDSKVTVPVDAVITTWDGYPAVRNSDGSYSTRLTATVEVEGLNEGAITNIPTIWEGQILEIDAAIQKAVESGLKFPTFDSIPEAVTAAKELSDSIGGPTANAATELLNKYVNLTDKLNELTRESILLTKEELALEIARQDAQLNLPLVTGDLTGATSTNFTGGAVGGLEPLSEALADVGERTIELQGDFIDLNDVITIEADQAARNLQSAMADFFFDPFEDGLEGMLKGFVDILRKMAAEVAAAQLLEGLGGIEGISSFIGGLFSFGGPKAAGGPVKAGVPYLVGEEGPEMVVPGENSTIVPNDQMFGGGVSITQSFDQRGASVEFMKVFPSLMEENNRRLIETLRDAPSRGRSF